jgi:hypothetical protein
VHSRLIEQKTCNFPIHGFVLIASRRDKSVGPKRWRYLGLLEYLRHYPDTQVDADGKVRRVWLFEFKIHHELQILPLKVEAAIAGQILTASRLHAVNNSDDDEIIDKSGPPQTGNIEEVEQIRGRLLSNGAKKFRVFHQGFASALWLP